MSVIAFTPSPNREKPRRAIGAPCTPACAVKGEEAKPSLDRAEQGGVL